MTTVIPTPAQATTTTYSLSSNAIDQTPTLGGPTQRIARLGDRWTVTFKLRSSNYLQGVALCSALIQGLSGKVRAALPQPGISTSGATSSAIYFANAAAAAGTSAALTGLTPGYVIQQGQFFNVSTNGVDYLYQASSQQSVAGDGTVTISFQPMLKAQPSTGDGISFANPQIEGFLSGNSQTWDLSLVQSVGITFSIREGQ